jgi:hypothetical protein
VHVAPWATDPHDIKHAIQKTLIVLRRLAQRPRSGRNNGEIIVHSIAQIATRQFCLPSKGSLELTKH